MDPPEPEELLLGLIVFLLVLPAGYWFMRGLFAILLGIAK
jgi:hypothetical protein|tara:strand:+ start:3978 stop:4097 length:120 start_codon:yes stop_codon:yes gene_type:complete